MPNAHSLSSFPADLHQKFRDQHREYSPEAGRPFYGYVTTAVVSVPCPFLPLYLPLTHAYAPVAEHRGDSVDSCFW